MGSYKDKKRPERVPGVSSRLPKNCFDVVKHILLSEVPPCDVFYCFRPTGSKKEKINQRPFLNTRQRLHSALLVHCSVLIFPISNNI